MSLRRADAGDDHSVGESPFKAQPFIEAPRFHWSGNASTIRRHKLPESTVAQREAGEFRVHKFIERPDSKPIFAYEVHVKEARQSFHSTIPPTEILGIRPHERPRRLGLLAAV